MTTEPSVAVEIRWTSAPDEGARLVAAGFEPVECSFADQSVVGPLEMDHHGHLSHLEGVATRAYRDHFGARREDPRFVVTGTADADATFAIAALAGLLPHPPGWGGREAVGGGPRGIALTREQARRAAEQIAAAIARHASA